MFEFLKKWLMPKEKPVVRDITNTVVEKVYESDFNYTVVLKTGHIKSISKKLYQQMDDFIISF